MAHSSSVVDHSRFARSVVKRALVERAAAAGGGGGANSAAAQAAVERAAWSNRAGENLNIALALCLAIASAQTAAIAPVTDFTQFFQGLNDQLGVTSDAAFDACEDVPLIANLQQTFKDLNASNTFALISDVLALYKDYTSIKTSCPALLTTYESFFSTFVADIKANPKTVGLQVLENALGNFESIYTDVAQALSDVDAQNFYDFGQDVAKVVAFVLGTYIN